MLCDERAPRLSRSRFAVEVGSLIQAAGTSGADQANVIARPTASATQRSDRPLTIDANHTNSRNSSCIAYYPHVCRSHEGEPDQAEKPSGPLPNLLGASMDERRIGIG